MMDDLLRDRRLVRILKPAMDDVLSVYTGGDNRGDYSGPITVACFKTEEDSNWTWEEIYQ